MPADKEASESAEKSSEQLDHPPQVGEENSQNEKPSPVPGIFAVADIIKVTVGKGNAEFGVHKGILVSKCPFFEKRLNDGMKETQEHAVSLPDDNPSCFYIVVEWMYSGRVRDEFAGGLLVNAYILADKLGMLDLQNAIADRLRGQNCPELKNAIWAWENLPEGCPVRQLLVDQLHHQITKFSGQYKRGTATTDMARVQGLDDLIRKSAGLTTALLWKTVDHSLTNAGRPSVNPSTFTGCQYHLHKGGKKCK